MISMVVVVVPQAPTPQRRQKEEKKILRVHILFPQMLPTQIREYLFISSRLTPSGIPYLHSLNKYDIKDQQESSVSPDKFDKIVRNEPCSKIPCSSQVAAPSKIEVLSAPEPP